MSVTVIWLLLPFVVLLGTFALAKIGQVLIDFIKEEFYDE